MFNVTVSDIRNNSKFGLVVWWLGDYSKTEYHFRKYSCSGIWDLGLTIVLASTADNISILFLTLSGVYLQKARWPTEQEPVYIYIPKRLQSHPIIYWYFYFSSPPLLLTLHHAMRLHNSTIVSAYPFLLHNT